VINLRGVIVPIVIYADQVPAWRAGLTSSSSSSISASASSALSLTGFQTLFTGRGRDPPGAEFGTRTHILPALATGVDYLVDIYLMSSAGWHW
jgi:hypothetical protein